MVYGYARVSTKAQAREGTSLEDQKNKLRNAGAEVIYADAFTGTKGERPELSKLLEVVTEGDTLVVCKLDRVARSIAVGVELIDSLTSRGVTVNILNLGVLDNTASGKLMRNVFLAFAEFERDMIVERTTEGRAIALENNPDLVLGRPRKESENTDKVIQEYLDGVKRYEECAAELGVNVGTFYSRVREYRERKNLPEKRVKYTGKKAEENDPKNDPKNEEISSIKLVKKWWATGENITKNHHVK